MSFVLYELYTTFILKRSSKFIQYIKAYKIGIYDCNGGILLDNQTQISDRLIYMTSLFFIMFYIYLNASQYDTTWFPFTLF